MYIVFDTETTGLPKRWDAPITDSNNWPRCIQIAWQLHDELGNCIEHEDYLVKADGFNIPYDAERIHGISTELANEQGIDLKEVLYKFNIALSKAKFVVGQNVKFDTNIMGAEFHRFNFENQLQEMPILDTCTEKTAQLCQIPGGRGGKFKLPTLTELHQHLFGEPFGEAHNATADVEATTRCFFELIRLKQFTQDQLDVTSDYFENFGKHNPQTIQVIGLKHINLKAASDKIREQLKKSKSKLSNENISENLSLLKDTSFVHLHNHSQYSILQSTSSTDELIQAAAKHKMEAVAITDHANMMGAFHFISGIAGHNKGVESRKKEAEENNEPFDEKTIKPIIGCELFVCENHLDKTRKDNGYQIVLIAKNKNGYHNLSKISSTGFVDGKYYVPRVDKNIIKQYKEDLIVLTGNLYGEVPSKILNIGEKQAEEALLWWKEEFGDDLYIELMRHNQEDEDRVNPVLLEFAKKHQIKTVATNNTYYTLKADANAHDILLCVNDGEKQATPIGRGRGFRFGLTNQEYYFKSQDEMKSLFQETPEAIINIQEVVDKIEAFTLARDVLLPAFDIPEKFQFKEDLEDNGKRGENAFLKHITYEGAKKRYGEITPEIEERLDFELEVIEKTGYPGYFLIVEDFIREARNMDVAVGPGRGSAAGSVVAYCLWITNLDPIKYDLLFERFLNPERVSMPDIDIDFDDEGRGRVMDYVIEKYGANQVAQIITYGTMAAKSSIRDTARVLDLPLFEADRIAKLIPNLKLKNIFGDDAKSKGKVAGLRTEEKQMVTELISISDGDGIEAETIKQAKKLEGSVRNTGIHACGVIITPDDITKFVPVALAKDSEMYCTQFDNSVVESAGLLKMDFLGLKTLTLIKDTVKIVKLRHNITLDPETFDLEDVKTYELFQRGETVGIFQYESAGMQKYMKELKPTVFADLIAMNALYRPGPIEYIPSFIRRKHGDEEIIYDLEASKEYLEETYGITVYQEQVMLLSQKLADFTKGEADVLRKAMGKKQIAVLAKMKPKFVEQAKTKGHDETTLEKIWTDWEAFASYAFNKSHSTCYAWIAYQTAYLKAHYPAEYMAAVLSNNMNDIKSVTFFMEECKRMGLEVLGPCVNESYYKFTVNKDGAVRFGMGAIKGVGSGAVATIVENREDEEYRSIFDLATKIDLRAANKKAFENLILAGGFDTFDDTHRAQYFHDEGNGILFFEKAIKYGSRYQESQNSSQVSLFGESSDVQIPEPEVPPCEEWGTMKKLAKEKEVVGIYISGHPLDDYNYNIKYFCNTTLAHFQDLNTLIGKKIAAGGIITEVQHRITKKNTGWATFTVEDYESQYNFRIFGEEYLKYKHFIVPNHFVYIKLAAQEGWTNKETGQKSDPRIKFTEIKSLDGILEDLSNKLTIQLNITTLSSDIVTELSETIKNFPGEKTVHFNIFEMDNSTNKVTEISNFKERSKVKTRLELTSKRFKVDINKDFLQALEKTNILFQVR